MPFQLAEELLVSGANIHPALGHTVGPPVFSIRVGGSNPCLGPRRSKTYWKSGSLRYSNGIVGLAAGEPGGSPSSLCHYIYLGLAAGVVGGREPHQCEIHHL